MKNFIKKYSHGAFFLYLLIYLPTFMFLEEYIKDYYIIHCKIDDMIPFVEIFIIPYYLWFLYIAFTYIFFFFKSREEFIRMATFLTIGMTLFLITSWVFPNGLPVNFRPELDSLGRDNIFIDMVRGLYSTDTSTNVFPSIHVFNSIGANIAFTHSKGVKKWGKVLSNILCISICLSTMFLKQHSIIDVIGGIILAAVLYFPIYHKKKTEQ